MKTFTEQYIEKRASILNKVTEIGIVQVSKLLDGIEYIYEKFLLNGGNPDEETKVRYF